MCAVTPPPSPAAVAASTEEKKVLAWPEDAASHDHETPVFSWLSRSWRNWTYSYMNILLRKGAEAAATNDVNQCLTFEDLFPVPQTMQSDHLVEVFESTSNIANASIYKSLWRIARPTFIPAGFCELLVVLCQTGLPLLVRQLLYLLETNPNREIIQEGLPYALAIFAVSVLNGFGNHRHRHLAMKTGVALRAALVNVLYQHILLLTPQGKQGVSNGQVTNLVAVETQKVFEVTQDAHLFWALPLSIALVSIFLYWTLGPSTLVGIAVLVLFVPLIQNVTSQMLKVRHQRTKQGDARVELISSMLQGIQVTKLNNYEHNFETRIRTVRDAELHQLTREMVIWATTLLFQISSPVLATGVTFATYVLLDDQHVLTAADTFTVLLLFSALRFPINFAGRLIGKAAQAMSAIERIDLFLKRPINASEQSNLHQNSNTDNSIIPLTLSKASFCVGESTNVEDLLDQSTTGCAFTVSEFNFSIPKGQVLAVCGPVGSGKSTLVGGILGEATLCNGQRIQRGRISYVPQTPFILNRTVRDNILFGLPFEEERYNAVLDACCLRPDLERLGEAGDQTEIGERGVTLSGGQRQRVSLARACYANADLIILDDPFSALDSGTGKQVFEKLIASPNALLKDTAVMLVTHAAHFITHPSIENILLIVEGRNEFYGNWDELGSFHANNETVNRAVEHIKSSVRAEEDDSEEPLESVESAAQEVNASKKENGDDKSNGNDKGKAGGLIQAEQREYGTSSLRTWMLWFQRAGGIFFFVMQILLFSLDKVLYVAVELFLARWTKAADGPISIWGIDFPSQTEGISAQVRYLQVYWAIILLFVLAAFVRAEWGALGGVRASRNVFYSMLSSVLRAPMSYFETVPMGRILNRFTFDTDVNDVTLTQVMSMFLLSCSWYVTGVVLQVAILPWSALAIAPVSVMYWVLMLHYRKSGPDLQRIDALSRSPLQSMVSECLDGATCIRVFEQEQNFVNRYRGVADNNSSAMLNFVSAQRWVGVRMEILGSLVVLVSSVLVVCLNDVLRLEAGLVGLLIMWASNFTITLNFLVDTFSEAEAAITAIERVDAMAFLPSEKPMETDANHLPPAEWPTQGLLEFDKVKLRYREGLPLVLKELSFQLPAGKSCGVVGRTGAGKSSITVALFRLVEIESGRISLDGVDLATLGLSDVRGRGMSIIPQDPFLAGATLRECLDPFHQYTDSAILDALRAVRMGGSSASDEKQLLSSKLEEGGSNYSVGERQLLNLARALLSQPKLLVLDEATASIDGETDAFIQKMLRTRFPNTTLITIAHRLETILDYDLCLVMDAGQAVEFGPPAELLEVSTGVLSELVDSTGPESSKALRELANGAYQSRKS